METKSNAKKVMYMVLMILFMSGVNATSIDLNEPVSTVENQYSQLTNQVNQYEVVSYISKHYDLISVEVDGYKVVLDFENNKIKEIKEYNNEIVDLELSFTRDDIIYLMENWQTMTTFEKIKFLLRSEMPIKDIITFSGIAVSMR